MIYLIYACLILPLPLLGAAWNRNNRRPVEFSVLTVSAALLLAAAVRSLKLTLLGSDYSHRLFTTIYINVLVTIALGLYLGIKRTWFAAVAALILGLGWLLAGAINSAV